MTYRSKIHVIEYVNYNKKFEKPLSPTVFESKNVSHQ